jgi:hypothetical protein
MTSRERVSPGQAKGGDSHGWSSPEGILMGGSAGGSAEEPGKPDDGSSHGWSSPGGNIDGGKRGGNQGMPEQPSDGGHFPRLHRLMAGGGPQGARSPSRGRPRAQFPRGPPKPRDIRTICKSRQPRATSRGYTSPWSCCTKTSAVTPYLYNKSCHYC